jgi:RES domain-containing protein
MGYQKERMLQEEDQGWRFSDDRICSRCVNNPYLKKFIRHRASNSVCTFCRRRGSRSIDFDILMELIGAAVQAHFNDAVNEAAWDSEEGGYFGETFDTTELVRDHLEEPSDKEEVIEAIIESLGVDREWCERNMYGLNGADRYIASWDEFCMTVKHRVRYFFDAAAEDEDITETIPVPQMLGELSDIISSAGLIDTVPAGTHFFRVRPHSDGETCTTWRCLGSPPDSAAVTNRMSAAGISVFYGAYEMATARAEVSAGMARNDKRVLTGAAWTLTRPLKVLNLTQLPPVPSFYSGGDDRDKLLFLHQFVSAITEPVSHDGREHIDYVPTQILTEYFRHRAQTDGIAGIVYPSVQRPGGRSVVIFASQRQLDPDDRSNKAGPPLTMDATSVARVRRVMTKKNAR